MIEGRVDGETRVFRLHLPTVGEEGFYQQITSYDAFRKLWSGILYQANLEGKWYPPHYFLFDDDNSKTYDEYTLCGGVWDFYDKIDWCYKSKTFI